MKQCCSILLLSLLTWLQFSRQLAYFHCRISNTFSATHCNCEDLLASNNDHDSDDVPLQKNNPLTAPDEFYYFADNTIAPGTTVKHIIEHKAFLPVLYTCSYCHTIWRPPCC